MSVLHYTKQVITQLWDLKITIPQTYGLSLNGQNETSFGQISLREILKLTCAGAFCMFTNPFFTEDDLNITIITSIMNTQCTIRVLV